MPVADGIFLYLLIIDLEGTDIAPLQSRMCADNARFTNQTQISRGVTAYYRKFRFMGSLVVLTGGPMRRG